MRCSHTLSGLSLFLLLAAGCSTTEPPPTAATTAAPALAAQPQWAVSIDNIEACSCPTFCQCYFSGQPALHPAGHAEHEHAMRYCRFNNAFRITEGHFGETKLDGLKIWMAGDLGGDFSKGEMDWAVVRFEPAATPAQREAAIAIVHQIFPVKWKSFTTGADAKIDWQKTDDGAWAKLNDGKSAEVALKPILGNDSKPVVIQNVKFWAAPKNSGFQVMQNSVEAYRDGDQPFEFKLTNGFFTTIQMSSADVKPGPQAAGNSIPQFAKSGASCCCE